MGIAIHSLYPRHYPEYVQYAKLGRIIGHEIGHGLDSTGIKHDAQGDEKEWLSLEDRDKFEGYAKCLVEQHDQFEVLPGKRINGTITLDDNIADDVGLKSAYRVFKRHYFHKHTDKHRKPHGKLSHGKKLLGLEKLSLEQLFFLSYATVRGDPIFSAIIFGCLINHLDFFFISFE